MSSEPTKDNADLEPDEIPDAPPAGLRKPYLSLSWHYIYWCLGMFIWSLACVVYFVMTHQPLERGISIALGVLTILLIVAPTVLFGGQTWHKRLAWITVIIWLFLVLFLAAAGIAIAGITRRFMVGRYQAPHINDICHLVLCGLTLAMAAWTIIVAFRSAKLVLRLSRGDWDEPSVTVRPAK